MIPGFSTQCVEKVGISSIETDIVIDFMLRAMKLHAVLN